WPYSTSVAIGPHWTGRGASRRAFPRQAWEREESFLHGHAVANLESDVAISICHQAATDVGSCSFQRVRERLSRDRVRWQGHGDVSQLCGQLAVPCRCAQTQRLDVPEQSDLLLELPLRLAELDDVRQQVCEQAVATVRHFFASGISVDL